jgi:hypothetical protein
MLVLVSELADGLDFELDDDELLSLPNSSSS